MYTNFRIQNFRGFKDLELKDIARVNLIAGKNNTGKTSLLEAIAVYSGQYDVVLRRLPERLYNDGRIYAPIKTNGWVEWGFLFNDFDEKQHIEICGKGKFNTDTPLIGSEQLRISSLGDEKIPDGHRVMRRMFAGDGGMWGGGLQFKIKETANFIVQHYVIHNIDVEYYIDYSKSDNPSIPIILLMARQSANSNQVTAYFSEMKRQRNTSLIVEILKIFDDNISDIELLEQGLYVDNGLSQLVALASMGDGIVRIAEIVLSMSAVPNGVLLIDEIENGLHYSVQTDIWKAIAKAAELFNVQIFATTHSREMIQAAHEAFKESDENSFRFYRLDRDRETQDIVAVRYSDNTIDAAIRLESEVRG